MVGTNQRSRSSACAAAASGLPAGRLFREDLRMLTRLLSSAAVLAALTVSPAAQAANFRWANDGDVGAMDPYTRQETVQLSFLSNIYEPLVRWNRDLKQEPALAVSWEQTSPALWRFKLRPGVKWQD